MSGALRSLAARGAASGSTFDDSGNSNRILAVVAILLVVGVGLLIFSYWYWRSTRPEPEALAPLELLGTRKVRKVSPEERRAALDQVRPVRPTEPAVGPAAVSEPEPPPLDLAAHAARDLPPLSELAVPSHPTEPPPPPPPAPVVSPTDSPADTSTGAAPDPADPATHAADPATHVADPGTEPAPADHR